jgi:murein L,D-transpeptidase YcbB/YkuD
MRQGDRGYAVVVLQHRLHATGDLTTWPPDSGDLFDEALAQAVRTFQQRHGLDADGIVGGDTRAALQVSVEERIRQLALNTERWHDLPEPLGPRYILINIPSFTLQVVENEQPVLSMRTVVGTPSRPTPLFRSMLTAVILNPAWDVPDRIAREEIVPLQRQEPAYLTTHHFTLLQGWGAETHVIAPHTIDWSQLSATHFPYRLRQEPGSTNALGRIKFLVPNPFHVFLHDTPARSLFRQPVRASSHGCIRLEQPKALAAYLLRDDPTWTRARIDAAIAQGQQRTIALAAPLPVYVIYHTAWVDTVGTVHFRPDIYAYDTAPAEGRHDAHAIPCG